LEAWSVVESVSVAPLPMGLSTMVRSRVPTVSAGVWKETGTWASPPEMTKMTPRSASQLMVGIPEQLTEVR
jgi:hypothetical protein